MNAPDWLAKNLMVEVDWIDITEECDIPLDKKVTPVECWSVGKVCDFDENFITIMREVRGELCDKQVFMWPVVTRVFRVEVPECV